MSRYWIGVASLDHVNLAVQGGFCQFNHGAQAPLRRLTAADWVIYYSPRQSLASTVALQAFTAAGRVLDTPLRQVQQTSIFQPFRKDVAYARANQAPIRPLLGQLSFTEGAQAWGQIFRRGFFPIEPADFALIVQAMRISAADPAYGSA